MATSIALPKEQLDRDPQRTLASQTTNAPAYNVSIGYLRAVVTLLVLAHHSVLAYVTFGSPAPTSLTGPIRWWEASPIVDSRHWSGFDLLVGFNDIFFMSLMFFLSGLFVWQSLRRKGAGHFLRDRALRLGVPFAVAAAAVAPIAYYPAYLQTGQGGGIAGFWQQWRALGNWPAGPAWFVWVLLAFDVIAAALLWILPTWGDKLGKLSSAADRHPIRFFFKLALFSAVAYIAMEMIFNAFQWSSWGPFTFQTSRILHYFVYFLFGAGVGAYGLSRGLLANGGKLARRWWLWAIGAFAAFVLSSAVGLLTLTAHLGSRGWEFAADASWVVSCGVSSFAFLALFVRFATTRSKIFDSLTGNAYGMYLIHYAFVGWLQLAVLKSQVPAIAKGSLAFTGTVLLSWGVTAALRRIPAVAKVI